MYFKRVAKYLLRYNITKYNRLILHKIYSKSELPTRKLWNRCLKIFFNIKYQKPILKSNFKSLCCNLGIYYR